MSVLAFIVMCFTMLARSGSKKPPSVQYVEAGWRQSTVLHFGLRAHDDEVVAGILIDIDAA